jgi:hypothetical protein
MNDKPGPPFGGGFNAVVTMIWGLQTEIKKLIVSTAIDLWLKQHHGGSGLGSFIF